MLTTALTTLFVSMGNFQTGGDIYMDIYIHVHSCTNMCEVFAVFVEITSQVYVSMCVWR